ncbi:DUF2806 domain-containing protein [Alcaligenes faecalis subsp. faecalis]|uniref:DUF2806 domain-containing protein n=1 Tax=Alcaligenes faecalis TaxID=511 RepID=UPI001F24CE3C|nr:DUF2806 domain-containing protein [Alcaligenes faecalis subsp. faecalis]
MIDVNLNVPLLEKMWDTLDKRFIATWMNPKRIEREGAARLKVERAQRLQAIEFQRRELDAAIGGELAVAGEPYIDFQRLSEAERQQEYIRKQTNLGKSILHAEDAIKADDPVPEKEVDPDWLYRWKEQAEKFSANDMQLLWGRVLAGEFKQPGTFNYRALNVLSDLTRENADSFLLLCSLSITGTDLIFIHGFNDINKKYGMNHLRMLELRELGLLSYVESSVTISKGDVFHLYKHKKAIRFIPEEDISINICLLTDVGRSIYKIVDSSFNIDYFRDFLKMILDTNKVESILAHNVVVRPDGVTLAWNNNNSESFRVV